MQPGPDLTRALDTEATTTVRVAGVVREHTRVTITAETSGEIPALGGSGIMSATGTIDWAPGLTARSSDASVSTRVPTPWQRADKWPPSPGDEVTIDATMTDRQTGQSVTCRQFTGRIRSTSGDVGGQMVSAIVDNTDNLDVPFKMRPLQFAMPSEDGAGGITVPVQLCPMTLIEWGLMTAGYQPSLGYYGEYASTLIFIPGQGSFFPRVGQVSRTSWAGQLLSYPLSSRWGAGTLVPLDRNNTSAPPVIAGRRDVLPLDQSNHEITVDFPGRPDLALEKPGGGNTSGDRSSVLRVSPGVVPMFELWRTGSGASVGIRQGGSWRGTLSVNATESVRVAVRLYMEGPDVRFTLRVLRESGETQDVSGGLNGPLASTAVVPSVTPWQGAFGAISYKERALGSTPWLDLNAPPKSKIELAAPNAPQTTLMGWRASPRWPGQGQTGTVLQLIKEASAALCAAVWIDENGLLRWRDAHVSTSAPAVETYYADESLLNMSWDDDGDQQRSDITLNWRAPMLIGGAKGEKPWVELGSAQAVAMERNDDGYEVVIKPADDEDWIAPSYNLRVYGPSLSVNEIKVINESRATAIVYTFENGSPSNWSMMQTYDNIVDETYVADLQFSLSGGPADLRVSFAVPDATGVVAAKRGKGTPIVCGAGKTIWTDRQSMAANTFSGRRPPTYTHEGGYWYQTSTVAQRAASWIASRTATPAAQFRDLRITPDLRLQLQDKITVRDPTISGVAVAGVVIKKSLTVQNGKAEQTVTIRTTGVTRLAATYAQLDLAASTYKLLDAQGRTYAQLDADPIGG